MTRIVTLLNEKNHYLEKFYSLNETELKNFLAGNFEGIETFYETREKILEIVKYIDGQLEVAQNRTDAVSTESRKGIREALTVKDEYVNRIIEQDLQILSCIESAKNEIIRELQGLKKGKKAISGYKSPTFGKRLDEEA